MFDSFLLTKTPKGNRDEVLWCIGQAHALKYEGVCFGIGETANPGSMDWGDFSTCVRQCASLNTKLRLRGGIGAPTYAYSGGVKTGFSAWVTKYNNGETWPQPYRPPIAVASEVGLLLWNKAWILARDIYDAAGLDPMTHIQFICSNEPGIGGANGPWLGSYSTVRPFWNDFNTAWKKWLTTHDPKVRTSARTSYLECLPSSFWPSETDEPKLGGYTEPGYFELLRAAIDSSFIPAEVLWLCSLEMAYGADGQREVASWVGTDAHYLAAKYPRLMINRYAPSGIASPADAAKKWLDRFHWSVATVRSNREFAGASIEVCEANVPIANVHSASMISECRNAFLKAMRGVVRGGVYCALPESLSDGNSLWDSHRHAIDGPVGPAKI